MFVQRINVIETSRRQTECQSNGFHGSYQYNCSRNYGCNDVCLHGPRLFWVPSCRVHLAFDLGVAAACCTRLFNGTGLRRKLVLARGPIAMQVQGLASALACSRTVSDLGHVLVRTQAGVARSWCPTHPPPLPARLGPLRLPSTPFIFPHDTSTHYAFLAILHNQSNHSL